VDTFMPLDHFQRLGLALAIGFLVGVERGWQARDVAEGGRTAGIRTYALIGLLGGLAGLLGEALDGWAFAAVGLPLAAAFILFKHREQAEDDDRSVTAIVAALLVFALGAYAVVGEGQVAAAAAVVATALLAFKNALHTWLKRLTWEELRSALVLLAMGLVALPLLPDRAFGPYDSVNPYELWLLTIAMAGISFAAYAAIKIFGPSKGVVVASAAGALVSSTAVTLYLARMNKAAPSPLAFAGAAVLAGGVMALRLSAIAVVLSPGLFGQIIYPLGAMAAVAVVCGLVAVWRGDHLAGKESSLPMKSPFELGVVVKFALVLGAALIAARVLTGLYGAGGLMTVAGIAGLVDADAVTLAASRMTAEGLDLRLGAYAVFLAVGADSVSKSLIALVAGGRRFGMWFAAGTALSLAAAAVAALLTA
jgi:uncharacterized membrane protein (DUF4010 family)